MCSQREIPKMVCAERTLAPLAGRRLLAIDPGVTYFGLAVRVNRFQGVQPYGLVERVPCRRGFAAARRLAASLANPSASWDWSLQRERFFGGRTTRFDSLAEALAHVLVEQQLAAAVVGMPYNADGSWSAECTAVGQQVTKLRAAWASSGTGVPVLMWDESFSTRIAVGSPRRGARSSHALAACVILNEVVAALHPFESDQDMLSELAHRTT
jgi:RNase H-fold protein (predicted Holliday junction resolvase)